MKITLVVLLGLVAVFNATRGEPNETIATIASELRKDVTKYGIQCEDPQIHSYCAKNHGQGALLHTLCPKIVEAYVCDYNLTDEDLEYFLKDLIRFG